ncbi:group II intron reverse transcriptase/maturase [Desulfobulbus propionicus]
MVADLQQVVSDASLYQAWSRVEDNQGCSGVDRQEIDDFACGLGRNLACLRKEVLAGTYRPLPLLRAWMPKKNGGLRPLAIPTVRDRVLQTAVALVLTPIFEAEFEACSFGYRRGRSVDQALRRVMQLRDRGYTWVVDADIQSFFDEIDHGLLLAEVQRHVTDPGIVSLIRLWLTAEIEEDGERSATTKGVPQGSPISPLLSNLYLDQLDEALLDEHLRLVRFADDFLVLCKSQDQARDALELTEDVLHGLRLRLNPDKTRIVDFKTGFRFLGVRFIRSLVLDSSIADEAPSPTSPKGLAWRASGATSDPVAMAPCEKSFDAEVPSTADHEETVPRETAPRLRTLYLLDYRHVLGKESERFVVRRNGRVMQEIPAIKVDQIMVCGNARITTPAMHFCLQEHIPIHLLSALGRYRGMISSFDTAPVLLHRNQFAAADDAEFCLALAREFVRGKIENTRVVLLRLTRRRNVPHLEKAAAKLKALVAELAPAESLDQVRGVEGSSARIFFTAVADTLDPAWGFHGRQRRPPPDPVNALFSYGYTILFHNTCSLLLARGLNPHVGYLHAVRRGHPALVSDIMEEFRPIIVDAVVLKLVLNQRITPEGFIPGPSASPGCLMNRETQKIFIRHMEAKFNASLTHPVSGQRLDYRCCIEQQAHELIDVIQGKRAQYRPMVLR